MLAFEEGPRDVVLIEFADADPVIVQQRSNKRQSKMTDRKALKPNGKGEKHVAIR